MDSLELITDNEAIYTKKNHPTKPNSLDYYILNQYIDKRYSPPVQDIKIIIIQLYIICLKLSESYPDNKNYSPDLINIIYDQGGLPVPETERLKLKVFTGDLGAEKTVGYTNTGTALPEQPNPCSENNKNSFFHAFAAMAFTLITGRKKTEERNENITGSSYDDWRYIADYWLEPINIDYRKIQFLIREIATPEEHLCEKSLDIIKVNTFKPLLELILDVLPSSQQQKSKHRNSAGGGSEKWWYETNKGYTNRMAKAKAKNIVDDENVKAAIEKINELQPTEFKTLFKFDKSVITTIFDEIKDFGMPKGGKKTRKKTKKRKNKKSKRHKTKRRKSKKH